MKQNQQFRGLGLVLLCLLAGIVSGFVLIPALPGLSSAVRSGEDRGAGTAEGREGQSSRNEADGEQEEKDFCVRTFH